jgi:hypothetical protein
MDSEPSQGVAWMRQGAAFGEYGLLPQLSLGNAYMRGTGGVRADPRQALAYYTQAERSLTRLESSQNPAAIKAITQFVSTPHPLPTAELAAMPVADQQNFYANSGQMFDQAAKALGAAGGPANLATLRKLENASAGSIDASIACLRVIFPSFGPGFDFLALLGTGHPLPFQHRTDCRCSALSRLHIDRGRHGQR